jgi:hypothetical protein
LYTAFLKKGTKARIHMRERHATDARGDGAAVGRRRRTAPASRGAERANQRGGQRREEASEDKDSDEESRACEQKIGKPKISYLIAATAM